MKKQQGWTVVEGGGVLVIFLWIAASVGWVWNIAKLVGMLDGSVTAMFIARIVGVVVAPLGSVLGYF